MQKRNPANRRFCQWDSSLHRMSSRFSFRLVFKSSVVIERSNFVVVNLPKNVVAKFGAEGFEFVERVEIE